MDIIACIPSRYQSSRLPGKPLALIHGKPMVLHVLERTAKAGCFTDVVCLTDHEIIYNTVREAGFNACMTSEHCASGTDRLIDYVKQGHEADVLVNVQGDEAMIRPNHLRLLVDDFCSNPAHEMGTLIYPTRDPALMASPSHVKVVTDNQGKALYFSRSAIPGNQQGTLPAQTHIHMGIYIYRQDILLKFGELPPSSLENLERLEQLRALQNGISIHTVEVEEHVTAAVDTPEDLERVRELLRVAEVIN